MSWFVQNINSYVFSNELYNTTVSTEIEFFENVFDAITFYKKKCVEALKRSDIIENKDKNKNFYIEKFEEKIGDNKTCRIFNKKEDGGYRALITIGPCRTNNKISKYLSLRV